MSELSEIFKRRDEKIIKLFEENLWGKGTTRCATRDRVVVTYKKHSVPVFGIK